MNARYPMDPPFRTSMVLPWRARRLRRRARRALLPSGKPGPLPQAALAGEDDRLRPGLHAELVEDVRDVVAHGLLREGELRGDLRVVQALRDALQDLAFPGREAGQVAPGRGEKGAQLLEKLGERGLVRKKDVVGRLERHETRARDAAREVPAFLERHAPVAAPVDHVRRALHARRRLRDIHGAKRADRAHGIPRPPRPALHLPEPIYLLSPRP